MIFVGFLFLLSRAKDIRRVFEFHGAEHKVVFNFESGKPVNVENAQQFVTWHPRCGTSFMFVIMLISTVVYMLIPAPTFTAKMVERIVLLPVITGLSWRTDPVRREAPRFFPRAADGAGAVDAAYHNENAFG